MSFYAARRAIVKLMEDNKASIKNPGDPDVPVFYPGEKEPEDDAAKTLMANPWARLSVFVTGTEKLEIGPKAQRRTSGSVSIGVFAPAGEGDGRALAIADRVASVYSIDSVRAFDDQTNKKVGVVRLRSPTVFPTGINTAPGSHPQYEVTVSCPFDYDFVQES